MRAMHRNNPDMLSSIYTLLREEKKGKRYELLPKVHCDVYVAWLELTLCLPLL